MHLAVEIGQAEIRRVERRQRPPSLGRGLAEAPCVELGVRHDGLSEQNGQRREIVTPGVDELALARAGHGHANVAFAESLRLELPSADPLQVVARKPQPAIRRFSIDASRNAFAVYDVDRHRQFPRVEISAQSSRAYQARMTQKYRVQGSPPAEGSVKPI